MKRKALVIDDWRRTGHGDGCRGLIIAAAISPFAGAAFDERSFEENIRYADAMGIDGILVAGTTGEASRLTHDARDQALRAAARALAPEVLIVSGIKPADGSPEAAADDAQRAAEAGADVALVAPPYAADGRDRDDGRLSNWYEAVARASPIPVLVYQTRDFAARPIGGDAALAIGASGAVLGIKDSTGDESVADLWRPFIGPRFAVFLGSARLFARRGADFSGAILALASVYPEEYLDMARRQAAGCSVAELALRLEASLQRFETGRIPALKAMHEESGLFGGD